MSDLKTMSAAVKVVLDGYKIGHQFYGNQLKDDVVRIFPEAEKCYVDTVLRMARRHRRLSFRVVDQNNSLYEKTEIKLIAKQIKKCNTKRAKKERPAKQVAIAPVQGSLFPGYFFLVVVFLGFVFNAVFGPGPRLSHCFRYSMSSSESSNIALTPMYRFGWYPCRFSLCLAASDDIPPSPFFFSMRFATSNTVYSITPSINGGNTTDQGENVKMSDICTYLLYTCIVKNQKICEFSKISGPKLDNPPGMGYIVYMSDIRTN